MWWQVDNIAIGFLPWCLMRGQKNPLASTHADGFQRTVIDPPLPGGVNTPTSGWSMKTPHILPESIRLVSVLLCGTHARQDYCY